MWFDKEIYFWEDNSANISITPRMHTPIKKLERNSRLYSPIHSCTWSTLLFYLFWSHLTYQCAVNFCPNVAWTQLPLVWHFNVISWIFEDVMMNGYVASAFYCYDFKMFHDVNRWRSLARGCQILSGTQTCTGRKLK